MSRESTPDTLFGGLAITGSPGSSNTEMPVTTRGMRHQRQRNLAASQHASSGTAAGPSRPAAPSSGRQAASRSSGHTTRRFTGRRRPRRTRTANDDDSDGNDGGGNDDGDSDDEDPGRIINEIMSTYADTYPSPYEFSRISPRNTRNIRGIEQT